MEPEKVRYAYAVDQIGSPVCLRCGVRTDPAYAKVPRLRCWSCGTDMRCVLPEKGEVTFRDEPQEAP